MPAGASTEGAECPTTPDRSDGEDPIIRAPGGRHGSEPAGSIEGEAADRGRWRHAIAGLTVGMVHSYIVRELNATFCVLLTAALLSASAPRSSAVLCISPAGHVAVEEAGAICCALKTQDDVPDSGSGVASRTCGSCTDIMLVAGTGDRAAVAASKNAAVSDSLSSVAVSVYTKTGFGAPVANQPVLAVPLAAGQVFGAGSAPLRC